ncbi:reverse transcriptase-like [Apostichopus japonicus]|uniref:Reverse transcriptase-like n=1 Tax=Stichopus japonicus TaxID=307972 RepID=A0A2G8JVA1_STIJA|nr:reverse transcriptase-like [Apostichopus japonicus]
MCTEELDEIILGGNKVEIVHDFNFLGSRIDDNGTCKGEIVRRLALGRAAVTGLNKIWRDKAISLLTKSQLMKVLVFPVVLYGSESWTITKGMRERIDSFELWCWRRLLRVPWTAHRTNISIVEQIKPSLPLEAQILRQQLNFFGHIMRADDSLEKSLMVGMGDGSRKRGRPRARWMDGVKQATGLTLDRLRGATRSRQDWRIKVMVITRVEHDSTAQGDVLGTPRGSRWF